MAQSISGTIPSAAGNAAGADALASAETKIFRRLISFLFILYVIAFLDRINFGFAAISMNRDLGLTMATFGFAGTVMYVGYFLFEIPSNILMVKFGARRWLSRIMISWGIASGATAFVTTETGIYFVRFLVGVAEAGFLPGVLLYLTYWIQAKQRARAVSLFMIAQPIAIGFGSALSGLIMANMDGMMGLAGWKWMFIVEALPAVIFGIMILYYLPDKPGDAKWLTQAEKDAVIAKVGSDPVKMHKRSGGLGEFITGSFLLLSFAYFALVTSLNALATWSPLIVQEVVGKDAGFLKIGLLSAIPGLLAAAAMPLWGASSDRRMERAWHYFISAMIAIAGWMFVALGETTTMRVLGLALATAGGFASMPILWTIPATMLTEKARPVGLAILSAIGILGSITSPAVVGMLREATGRFNASIYYAATLLFLSAVIFVVIARPLQKVHTAKAA
jgi:ACS family 4-hydroxyphenylacetate permease-like MFS transporter